MATCWTCARPLEKHDLAAARDCLEQLLEREPPYCRLIGPADPRAWSDAAVGDKPRREVGTNDR